MENSFSVEAFQVFSTFFLSFLVSFFLREQGTSKILGCFLDQINFGHKLKQAIHTIKL